MRPIFLPLPDATAAHYRSGGPDAYGLRPERRVADGGAIPCRHSLRLLPAGTPYLIVAHRPFAGLNPYAETGPIFLAAEDTPGAAPTTELPPFLTAAAYIVRGYSLDERIVYGTGAVTPTEGFDYAWVRARGSYYTGCFGAVPESCTGEPVEPVSEPVPVAPSS